MNGSADSKAASGFLEKARERLNREVLEIEDRQDLSDDEKVSRIINIFSTTCAAVAVQPIPFADIFVLTPIQAFMGARIGAIRGIPVSEAKSGEIIKELGGVVGLGIAAQQIAIGAYKTGLPFLGGFMTIPLVYGLTYGIGRVMDYYFTKKARGRRIDPAELKKVWRRAKSEGKEQGARQRSEIRRRGDSLNE